MLCICIQNVATHISLITIVHLTVSIFQTGKVNGTFVWAGNLIRGIEMIIFGVVKRIIDHTVYNSAIAEQKIFYSKLNSDINYICAYI